MNLQIGCSYHHSLWLRDVVIESAEMLFNEHEHLLPIPINDKSISQIGFTRVGEDEDFIFYSHILSSENGEIDSRGDVNIWKEDGSADVEIKWDEGVIEMDVKYIHEVQQLFSIAYGIIPIIEDDFADLKRQ